MRFLPLFASLALVSGMSACGGDSTEAGTADGSSDPSGISAPDEPIVTTPDPVVATPKVQRGERLDAPVPDPPPPTDDVRSPSYGTDAIQGVAGGLGDIDLSKVQVVDDEVKVESADGVTAISWRTISMQDLPMEDILDKLLYPEDYGEDEFNFPPRIADLDGQEISIVGYMIPLEWDGTKVPEFMLVRDLLGCCFGGAPQPDEWMEVIMADEGADYFPYIPVLVTGKLSVEGIEDEAGYAAGCFVLSGKSVVKDF